ncbi:MAG: hypothetical protein DRN12_04505 [Thermoplasmata archaeon]|nr:MAG: hypothetical protein DRN12_04505 [Thermoplasmata archaeon]HEC89544.1 hypothetical protein [Thermoplasmatales archaeon]
MKKKQIVFALLSIFILTTSALVFATPIENNLVDNKPVINTKDTPPENDTPPDSVKIIGAWGYMDDRTPDGYFGGKIIRKGRFAVFRGVFNETDSDNRTPFICIMKKGYLIGKVTTDDGIYRVVGLYRIDREKHLLKFKWMTAKLDGWAVGRIRL